MERDAICCRKSQRRYVINNLIGFSGREMADVLKIKETAQQKLVSYVRGRLRKHMAKAHYTDIAELTDRYRDSALKWNAEMDEEFGFLYASRSILNDLLRLYTPLKFLQFSKQLTKANLSLT